MRAPRVSKSHQFLQEIDASIVLTDMRGFIELSHAVGPVDLGIALSTFYGHVGGITEKHGGRIVKFVGDGVLSVFAGMKGHRDKALAAVSEMAAHHDGWLADNAKVKLPKLDYVAAATSGEILVGDIGTDHIRFWDVLGAPVNLAFMLCRLATDRGVLNLVDADVVERSAQRPACLEVEAAELAGKRHRLFRIG